MLVKDLIAKLQQYDEYTEVYANYDYDFLALQEINPHVEKIDHKGRIIYHSNNYVKRVLILN